MPKIGSFRYPEMSMSDAIRVAQRLAGGSKAKALTKAGLAKALGYKGPRDKRFAEALEDLTQLGLVELHGDQVVPTGLVRRLAQGDTTAGTGAITEACFNIQLYSALNDGLQGAKLPSDEELALALRLLTSASERQVKPHVQPVMDRLLELTRHAGR